MLSSTFESLLLFYLKFTNLWPKILPRSPFYFQLCWCYSRVCNQAVKRGSLADVTYQVPHKQWIDAITSLALWVSYLCQFVVSTCHCTVLYDVILKVPETVGGWAAPKTPRSIKTPTNLALASPHAASVILKHDSSIHCFITMGVLFTVIMATAVGTSCICIVCRWSKIQVFKWLFLLSLPRISGW